MKNIYFDGRISQSNDEEIDFFFQQTAFFKAKLELIVRISYVSRIAFYGGPGEGLFENLVEVVSLFPFCRRRDLTWKNKHATIQSSSRSSQTSKEEIREFNS